METTFKQFKGIVTDGDSPDMPLETCRVLKNLDIDKSTQKLIVRHPFFEYEDLGSFPSYIDFSVYKIVQYTVGIIQPQRNTLVILRSNLPSVSSNDPNKYDWRIYSNAPMGGDGESFILVGFEIAKNHCNPEAVLGRVRMALGNDENYRIFFPHETENGDPILRYFPDTQGSYLVTDFSTTFSAGELFKEGVNGVTKTHLYMDGRLYSFLNRSQIKFSVTQNESLGVVLPKGNYKLVVAPQFDTFPVQYGAAIASDSVNIVSDPIEVQQLTNIIQVGFTYQVNDIIPHEWVLGTYAALRGLTNHVAEPLGSLIDPRLGGGVGSPAMLYFFTTGIHPGTGVSGVQGELFFYNGTTYVKANQYTIRYYDSSNNQITIPPNVLNDVYRVEVDAYMFNRASNVKFFVRYDGVDYGSGQTFTVNSLSPGPGSPANAKYVDIIMEKDGIKTVLSQLYQLIPYRLMAHPITNPSSDLLFPGAKYYGKIRDTSQGDAPSDGDPWVNTVNGASWSFFYKDTPLIESLRALKGMIISTTLEVPINGFNPRITDLNLFIQQDENLDLLLLRKIKVREDSTNSGEWGLASGVAGNFARFELSIDSSILDTSFETWGALYDTDGVGFRPTSHTEEDITRRMSQMVAMRDRMFAIGVDGDQGQEIVGRTPVSNGQAQHDVWFRPLISHAGKGKAVNYGIEFQDRLVWFQDTSLIHGSFGDSRRQGDFYFHSTGDGVGTKLFRSIARSNQALFFCNYDGIFRFDGGRSTDITIGQINHYWRYQVAKVQKDAAIGAYNPKTNEYWMFVPDLDDSVNGSTSKVSGMVWIWDDNNYPGQHWRTYDLSPYFPQYMFYDTNSNFIFVSSQENLYFWPGEDISGFDPVYPIEYEMETQNFNERKLDIVPDELKLVREDNPIGNMVVSVFRNNISSSGLIPAGQVEEFTFLPPGTNKQSYTRRTDRRRSDTLRLKVSGTYNPTSNHLLTRPEIKELTLSFIMRKKRT